MAEDINEMKKIKNIRLLIKVLKKHTDRSQKFDNHFAENIVLI